MQFRGTGRLVTLLVLKATEARSTESALTQQAAENYASLQSETTTLSESLSKAHFAKVEPPFGRCLVQMRAWAHAFMPLPSNLYSGRPRSWPVEVLGHLPATPFPPPHKSRPYDVMARHPTPKSCPIGLQRGSLLHVGIKWNPHTDPLDVGPPKAFMAECPFWGSC